MSGLAGYFVAPGGWGDVSVWRENDDRPVQVLTWHSLRDDPELWDAIVAMVEGAS